MAIDKSLRQHYDVPNTKKIKGQLHRLAYITSDEAKALKKKGGIETRTPEGIIAYPGHHGSSGSSAGVSQGGGGGGGGGGDHHPPARPTPVTTAVAPPSILSKPTQVPDTGPEHLSHNAPIEYITKKPTVSPDKGWQTYAIPDTKKPIVGPDKDGIFSQINLKDKGKKMAKTYAKNLVMKKLGLGWLNPFLMLGSMLFPKQAKALTSKFKAPKFTGSKYDKLNPNEMKNVRTRDDTPPRDGEGGNIQTAITGDKGLLTEGAETLGITKEQREQYLLMQNKMKTALGHGSYTNQQGQVIQLNEQQQYQLQNYVDKLDNILQTTLQKDQRPMGAVHGGRIDGPLTGGSRYI